MNETNGDVCVDQTVLTAFLAGQLSSEQHARVEAHIDHCPQCQQRLGELDESAAVAGADSLLNGLRDVAVEYRAEDVPALHAAVAGLKAGRADPPFAGPAAEPNRSELVNETIGDYRIVREVGHGGMGIVYEAEQLSLRRRVAVKTLPFASLLDANRLARFQNEARMAAHLEHPHIVPVYAVGVERGIHFYAMRFVNGPNLAQILRDVRERSERANVEELPLATQTDAVGTTVEQPWHLTETTSSLLDSLCNDAILDRTYLRAVTALIRTAAEAVDFAHSQGIVHRDIKPSNLMLDASGHLWVADFGLARIAGEGSASTSGALLGTVPYMSPEQASLGGGVVDQRSDVYSLGATLYELVTLVPPFGNAAAPRLLQRIATEEPLPPKRLNSGVPRDLETIILKTLAKEPADRYATARELASDLSRFLESRPIVARRRGLAERTGGWLRRHPAGLIAGLTAIVAIMLVAGGFATYSAMLRSTVRDLDRSNAELKAAKATLETTNVELAAAKDDVQTSLESARRSELRARQQLYVDDVNRAAQSVQDFDHAQATAFLDRVVPGAGESDVRGIEWYLLKRRCRGVGQTRRVSPKHMHAVCYSPDGRWLAAGGADAVLHVWELPTWKEHLRIATGQTEINAVVFSRDGGTIFTTGDDGSIRAWQLSDGTGRIVVQLARPANETESPKAFDLRLSADESTMISSWWYYSKGTIRLFDIQTGMPAGELTGHGRTVKSIDLSPDGRTLVSSSSDGTARLWSLETLTHIRTLDTGEGHGVVSAAFSADGKFVATGGGARTVWLWRCGDGARVLLGSHHDEIQFVRFLPSGAGVLAADKSGSVRIWSIPADFLDGTESAQAATTAGTESKAHDSPLLAWQAHTDRIHGLVFSPNGEHVVTASSDGTLRITDVDGTIHDGSWPRLVHCVNFRFGGTDQLLTWRVKPPEGRPTLEIQLHDLANRTSQTIASPMAREICTAALSPDGQTIVLGHVEGQLTIVPRAAGAPAKVVDLDSPYVVDCLQFLPDGQTLIVQLGYDPDGVRFLDTVTWKRFKGYPQQQVMGQFHLSVSGQRLVTCNSIRARVCDFSHMPATLRTFDHSGGVGDADLSPDETLLATACDDRTIKLWDVATGNLSGELIGHTAKVINVSFSPDGLSIISHGQEESTKVWHVPTRRFLFDLGDSFHSIRFSPSGKYLACAQANGGIVVHNLEALRQNDELVVAE